MRQILVVDDEKNMCEVLKILLENHGYSVLTAADGSEAIERINNGEIIDLIISDLKMPGIDGMGILKFLKENEREIPLILITAYGSIEGAVEAIKMGAVDFITKPFNKDVISHVIARIFQMENLENENKHLKGIIRNGPLLYRSGAMKQILETVQKVASVSTPVLIMGESGSGKGLIAEAIHTAVAGQVDSSRPFIAINCPTIPETLLESELFGYRKGAFTGANKDFPGKVRLAEGGTLFLDEIGDFPLSIQAKLLRLLEEKCFEPLGSSTIIKINTRILCATNRDLRAMVAEGLFRKDLYYRINTITIQIPPLRERPEDIIPISEHFLARYAGELGKCIMGLTEAAKMVLREYSWPGNVRELRNVMERAAVLNSSGEIRLSDLPRELQEETALRQPRISRLENIEKQALVNALNCHQWNISAAARELGISRGKLRHRLHKYELTGG